MKCQLVLPACLLLLWTLTASVSCQDKAEDLKILVGQASGGLKLTCGKNNLFKNELEKEVLNGFLPYADKNTGEYTCTHKSTDGGEIVGPKIYVKFRTCDNCIELDLPTIVGIVIGNVAATIVIGVAVYLTASQNRIGPITSHKKSSDRQPIASSRAPNVHYEPLKRHQKDTYDELNNRK